MTIAEKLAQELNLKQWQVDNTIALLDEGNTIPFISRYRKEATGELNDEILRKSTRQKSFRSLRIFTAHTDPSAGPVQLLPRKKVLSLWLQLYIYKIPRLILQKS